MTTLAIVYHSGYGHAAALADHVAKGAASAGGVSVKTYKAEELASPDKGPWEFPPPNLPHLLTSPTRGEERRARCGRNLR